MSGEWISNNSVKFPIKICNFLNFFKIEKKNIISQFKLVQMYHFDQNLAKVSSKTPKKVPIVTQNPWFFKNFSPFGAKSLSFWVTAVYKR